MCDASRVAPGAAVAGGGGRKCIVMGLRSRPDTPCVGWRGGGYATRPPDPVSCNDQVIDYLLDGDADTGGVEAGLEIEFLFDV